MRLKNMYSVYVCMADGGRVEVKLVSLCYGRKMSRL